jgi:hypothetical protein
VSVDGGAPVALDRSESGGVTAYRADGLTLLRTGPRVVFAADTAAVVVRNGDTLGRIAVRVYGDRNRAFEIARANADQISNPDLIHPGQVLRLPEATRRCRRMLSETSATPPLAQDGQGGMERRLFSPPSRRQPDQRRVLATTIDRER